MRIQLSKTVWMEFREIKPGRFRMGARGYNSWEEPRHWVEIANLLPGESGPPRTFYLGTFPVTQAEFAVYFPKHKNHFDGRRRNPAENLSWDEAQRFCDRLTRESLTPLPNGYIAGLPTEAQWEYACRAGTETEYYTGDGEEALRRAGWFDEDWNAGSTHPVGSPDKTPNAWGLHDMHGNVWEWCRDAWDADAYKKSPNGVRDPLVEASSDADRVIRGGSWDGTAWFCRSAIRDWWGPGNRNWLQGFRVCLFPGPVDQKDSKRSSAAGDEGRRQADRNRKPGAERKRG